MSKRILVLALVLAFALTLTAQTTAGSQTNTSASGSASVAAGKQGAEVNAGASAAASQEAAVSKSNEKEKKPASGQAGASASGSGSASASAHAGKPALSSGTTIEAMLTKSLHAKKNKEGDKVEAKTSSDVKSEGQVVIPKGSKLLGHVTQAKARAKGESDSVLGIRFDRALLKDGREVPLNVVIQAVAAAQSMASADLGPPPQAPMTSAGSARASGRASGGGSAGGGLLGGVGSTVGAVTGTAGNLGQTVGGTVDTTVNTAASATGAAGSTQVVSELTSTTTGVVGLEGLKLDSAASNATQGSLITSDSANVNLASGTRMLLRAQ